MQRILPMALVSVILSINAQTARSESPSLKHSQFVLESIREQRQSLQSWHFRATGRLSNTHPTDSKHNKAIDFKYLCARDTQTDQLRFDAEISPDANETGLLNKIVRLRDRTLVYRMEESKPKTKVFDSGSGIVDVMPADYFLGSELRMFDVRAIGHAFRPVPSDLPYEKELDHLSSPEGDSHVKDVRHADGGVTIIEWEFVSGDAKRRTVLFVKEDQGFIPIQREDYTYDRVVKKWLEKPTCVSETTWLRVNSVWVPETFHWEYNPPPEAPSTHDVLHMAFEWERVNKPLDAQLFTPEGLDVPSSSQVVDSRTGYPIMDGTLAERAAPSPQPIQPQRGMTWKAWVMFGGGAVMALFALFIARSRKRE